MSALLHHINIAFLGLAPRTHGLRWVLSPIRARRQRGRAPSGSQPADAMGPRHKGEEGKIYRALDIPLSPRHRPTFPGALVRDCKRGPGPTALLGGRGVTSFILTQSRH